MGDARPTEEIPEALVRRLRAHEMDQNSIDKICDVVVASGHTSVDDLLALSGDDLGDLYEDLMESGLAKADRVAFKEWLKNERNKPQDFRGSHFLNFADKLNDSDVSGLGAATVLRVDIDPRQGSDNLPMYNVRVPFGIIDAQVQQASTHHVPVISMLGPTGAGKSFLTTSFTGRSSTRASRPLVAKPNQNVPTSANVCVHRGQLHPGSSSDPFQVVCLDFEGEDGQTPKNLIDMGKRHLKRHLGGISDDAAKAILKETVGKRTNIVKKVLPPLAYLISDVVMFIDTVEPRRTERVDRIREFAEMAHESVESLSWRPALIIVQNKWIRGSNEEQEFDITSDYGWIVEGLESVFSRVTVIRIPPVNDKIYFEKGMCALHDAVRGSADFVADVRIKEEAIICSEREFWLNFSAMVNQFHSRGTGERLATLETVVAENRSSRHPSDNALKLLSMFGKLPLDQQTFHYRIDSVLEWYAYSLAGEARARGKNGNNGAPDREGLRRVFGQVLNACLSQEPCAATLVHNGKSYPCTQRRVGHSQMHCNPAMLKKPSASILKWAFSFGLWKDKIPCSWVGDMEPFASKPSFEGFQSTFDHFMKMDDEEYQVASGVLRGLNRSAWLDAEQKNLCPLCLRSGQELVLLPDAHRHPLCRDCVRVRKAISNEHDQVICPFCHTSCKLHDGEPDENGFRILSLDGGGIRGLVEISVLRKLEQQFAPLSITDLFDVIIGTSAGGIISMALLAGVPLCDTESLMKTMAEDILDVGGWKKKYRLMTNQPICDSAAFEDVLIDLFGKDTSTKHFQASKPPYIFCTSYNPQSKRTWVMGNFRLDWTNSLDFESYQGRLWKAARATAAAPTYFSPTNISINMLYVLEDGSKTTTRSLLEFVDGGIQANCPAKFGLRLAKEMQLQGQAEKGNFVEMVASIGTGAESETPAVENAGVLMWGERLINIALDSERMWEDAEELMRHDPALRDVPKIRINPPDLGSLDPFQSKSIKPLEEGMEAYFESSDGNDKMNELFHMTFAKLWTVPQIVNPTAGEPMDFCITLRESLCDFTKMERRELLSFIEVRSEGEMPNVEADLAELIEQAKCSFVRKPFVPALEGYFVYSIDGEEFSLPPDERMFTFEKDEAGVHTLNVVWRTENYGDFPICGVPRMMEVIGPKEE